MRPLPRVVLDEVMADAPEDEWVDEEQEGSLDDDDEDDDRDGMNWLT